MLIHADHPGFAFTLRFGDDANQPEHFAVDRWTQQLPARLSDLWPADWRDKPKLIGRRTLRDIPIGELVDHARDTLANRHWTAREILPNSAEWSERFDSRPGRAGRDLHDYAVIAAQYVEALPTGRPNEVVAKALRLKSRTVTNLVYQCREKGLLTATPKGRAGGNLTEEAVALLKGED